MTAERESRIGLVAGEAHSCPYLDGRQSRLHFVDPRIDLDPALLGALLARGFRRSGRFVYRPGCDDCTSCIAIRLPVDAFMPDRSQRRSRNRNQDLSISISAPHVDDEHFDLYRRYIGGRHADGAMADPSLSECEDFLCAPWCETRFLDLRLQDRLIATAVTDLVPDALSAVYTFFDPELDRRSLGTLAIVLQAELARSWHLDHLYLGYWVAHSAKMDYKSRFRPQEQFVNGRWRLSSQDREMDIRAH